MSNVLYDFEKFMKRREEIAQAYVNGDAAPLGEITTNLNPATFFSPGGDYKQGSVQVYSTYESDAKKFASGKTNFEILQMGASDNIAYWVGFQRATVFLEGNTQGVPFNLRITEIFRLEDNEWKLVHRHADALKSEIKENKE